MRDHAVERGDLEGVWAFLRGMSDVFGLVALSIPRLGEVEFARGERSAIGLGRLLDLVSRKQGEEGIQGPNPRANDLRVAGRRPQRNPNWSTPRRPAPPFDPKHSRGRASLLLRTLARAHESLPPPARSPEIPAAVDTLAPSLDAVLDHLTWLEQRGRTDDLIACMEEGKARSRVVMEEVEQSETAEDLESAVPALANYAQLIDLFVGFVLGLSRASDGDEAERALDALMADLLEP